jgi:hypothetical protein
MSNSNSLAFREAGSLISFAVTASQAMIQLWHHRTGSTVFLPHLAAATELLVINLVAQHDPQPNPRLASCSHSRFAQSLLCQLAPIETLQLWISPYRVYDCFTPEKTQEWVTLFAQPTEPLLTAAGIFAGNHPHVAHHRFAESAKRAGSPKNTLVANAVTGPTPGWLIMTSV